MVKSNDKIEEMLGLSMYALNWDSKSGVLKQLALWGFENVILGGLGVDELHKLTRGDRSRLIRNKPNYKHFREKVI